MSQMIKVFEEIRECSERDFSHDFHEHDIPPFQEGFVSFLKERYSKLSECINPRKVNLSPAKSFHLLNNFNFDQTNISSNNFLINQASSYHLRSCSDPNLNFDNIEAPVRSTNKPQTRTEGYTKSRTSSQNQLSTTSNDKNPIFNCDNITKASSSTQICSNICIYQEPYNLMTSSFNKQKPKFIPDSNLGTLYDYPFDDSFLTTSESEMDSLSNGFGENKKKTELINDFNHNPIEKVQLPSCNEPLKNSVVIPITTLPNGSVDDDFYLPKCPSFITLKEASDECNSVTIANKTDNDPNKLICSVDSPKGVENLQNWYDTNDLSSLGVVSIASDIIFSNNDLNNWDKYLSTGQKSFSPYIEENSFDSDTFSYCHEYLERENEDDYLNYPHPISLKSDPIIQSLSNVYVKG